MAFRREGLVCLTPDRELLGYWCPGCAGLHVVRVAGDGPARWTWDGNAAAPTLSPSIRTFTPAGAGRDERTWCHHFLRGGVLEFLGDSAEHALRGFHPLPPIPADYGGVEP